MHEIFLFFLLIFIPAYSASPTPGDDCVITDYNEVETACSKCFNLVVNGITIPAGKQLKLNLKDGAILTFRGHIKFEFENWSGPLINIYGNKVTVRGEAKHSLDGQGQLYWDGKGGAGTTKPLFMHLYTTGGSLFENINILNCPERCVSVQSQDTVFNKWNIDVSLGNTKGGHNTDGFDISHGKNLQFKNSVIKNQDDCVAINSGSDLSFNNIQCHGCHGLSISVGLSDLNGDENTVKNVSFTDCKIFNSDNAIHIKTHPSGGTGVISNIVYKNIEIFGIRNYGIEIEQDYGNRGHLKANVPIESLTITNVTGTMANSKGKNVYIACASGGCDNWDWSGVKITGGSNQCNYKPNGFICER